MCGCLLHRLGGGPEVKHWVFCTFLPGPPQYWGPLPTANYIQVTFLKPALPLP